MVKSSEQVGGHCRYLHVVLREHAGFSLSLRCMNVGGLPMSQVVTFCVGDRDKRTFPWEAGACS